MSLDENLRKFSREIQPPNSFTELSRVTVLELVELLAAHTKFAISHFVIGGGHPAGKNTSTCLKTDADVTVYVPVSTRQVSKHLDLRLSAYPKFACCFRLVGAYPCGCHC